jgi:hypothetical protein
MAESSRPQPAGATPFAAHPAIDRLRLGQLRIQKAASNVSDKFGETVEAARCR